MTEWLATKGPRPRSVVDTDNGNGPLISGRHLAAATAFSPETTLMDGRLTIVGVRGRGGTGVVYEAFDAVRKAPVALKALSHREPAAVYRVKSEFRALAGLCHPNLVRIYELFASEGAWFFTMELVDGEPFDEWVRPRCVLDEQRLRLALPQLVEGVLAIHAYEKVHRDLKPRNILVTPAGRVVILDFGLVAPAEDSATLSELGIYGTPGYMAPEQAAGQRATVASDYYALGVILFEAITGQLPFQGRPGQVLAAKQRDRAPAVSSLRPDTPDVLAALCDDLLQLEAESRPRGVTLRARLAPWLLAGDTARPEPTVEEPHTRRIPESRALFAGRDSEMAELRRAFADSCTGSPTTILVTGESGIGKSCLVHHFLDGVRADGEVVVLATRCYERENVPYRAFDAIIDELSRFLRRLPREVSAAMLPRDVSLLVDVFPVLGRVAVVASAPIKDVRSPHERERRAFVAFKELIARIRDRFPLVFFIDDLQWVDADSLALLRHFMLAPELPPVLFIAGYRREQAQVNALLADALSVLAGARVDARELLVPPLTPGVTVELAHALLGSHEPSGVAERIAADAGGSPFFVAELARFCLSTPGSRSTRVSVSEVIAARVASLPELARDLLAVLAVSRNPIRLQIAGAAAALGTAVQAAADLLCEQQLARSEPGLAGHELECYHDRIRDCVIGALGADTLRSVHRRIALSMERSVSPDALSLAVHWEAAGAAPRAARCAARAAHEAMAVLAFERGTVLCQMALRLGSLDANEHRALQVLLAEAYEALGRGVSSAGAYLAAAEGADDVLALDLRRRAAERLLMCGELDQGRRLIEEVLCSLGMPVPAGSAGALLSFAWQRARARVEGLRFTERTEHEVDRWQLTRLDASWSCAMGLAMTDNIRGADYQTRHLRLALDAGVVSRVARALILEYGLLSRLGANTRARTDALYVVAHRLCERERDPYLLGLLASMRSNVAYLQGNLLEADAHGERAVELLDGVGRDATFQQASAVFFLTNARVALGRFEPIRRMLPGKIAEAERRDDVHALTLLLTCWQRVVLHLVDDRVEESKQIGRQLRARYTGSGYHLAHIYMTMADALDHIYAGEYGAAYQLLEQDWPALVESKALRVASLHATLLFSRAGAMLGVARLQRGAERHALLRRVRRIVRTMHALESDWPNCRVLTALSEAAIAATQGDRRGAGSALATAVAEADGFGEGMFAAAGRMRLGELVGGSHGAVLRERATAEMVAQGVVNVARMSELLAPCCALSAHSCDS